MNHPSIKRLVTFNLFAFACLLCGFIGIPKHVMNGGLARDSVWFEFEDVTGIGYEKGVSRRDPSDIIKYGDRYYVWYTKISAEAGGERTPLYNSGYYGTIWYATSVDGYSWTEQGVALGPGNGSAFDSHSVFTPNILKYNDRFYLYYTGVRPTPGSPDKKFENNSETDITCIGVAVSDTPDGHFQRFNHEPVIQTSTDEQDFDSYRVDDAALLIKDKMIWLYYKGRSRSHQESGPRHTRMGVAFATSPRGPFKKYEHPILDKSHEVLIWNQDNGVASLAALSRSLYFATDGLNFTPMDDNLTAIPHAPGLYRPHLTDDSIVQLPGWGISHAVKNGDVYLLRFKLHRRSR